MIYPLLNCSRSAVCLVGLWLGNVVLSRALLPSLFATRAYRKGLALALFGLGAAHAAWALFSDGNVLGRLGITTASVAPVFLTLSLLSIPFAGVFLSLAKRGVRPSVTPDPVLPVVEAPALIETPLARELAAPAPLGPTRRLSRRGLLTAAAAVAPALAMGAGIQGFRRGFSPVAIRKRSLVLPLLPEALEGLRILQLSDVHLGVYRQLGDLEAALELAARESPDLVVITGDFVEHGDLLPDALDLVLAVRPKLGVVACLGNHEYFQSIRDIRTTYERKGVPLLVDEALSLTTDSAKLSVLGIDDPRSMGGDLRPALEYSLERTLAKSSGDFQLLLSHRPEAILPASELDLGLVLSGHTHGGQIGFNGKSAFEALSHDGYLWGPYTRARTGLYTTSGFGHWYPFRLGCESELPLLELSRARLNA